MGLPGGAGPASAAAARRPSAAPRGGPPAIPTDDRRHEHERGADHHRAAVGRAHHGARSRPGRPRGGAPALTTLPPGGGFTSLSCISDTFCIAAGGGTSGDPSELTAGSGVAESWDGASWSDPSVYFPARPTGRSPRRSCPPSPARRDRRA